MSKKIIVCAFLICFSFGVVHVTESQSDEEMFQQLESGKISVKNPFETRLPIVIEEPKAEAPHKPVPVEETVESPKIETPPAATERPPRPTPILNIEGIVWNSDRPQAIIDNKIVNIGDVISEVHITAIHASGIEGMFDGRTVTLPYKGARHE